MDTGRNGSAADIRRLGDLRKQSRVAAARREPDRRRPLYGALLLGLAAALLLGRVFGLH